MPFLKLPHGDFQHGFLLLPSLILDTYNSNLELGFRKRGKETMVVGSLAAEGRCVAFREKNTEHQTEIRVPSREFSLSRRTNRNKDNQQICSLDPLKVDAQICLVPFYNKNKETQLLIQLLSNMVSKPLDVLNFNYFEAAAAMRDVGILLGSIKRHGLEPAEVVPQTEKILFLLSEKLNLPPRDTLISYTIWNPSDKRERTYTDFADESNLIKSVRTPMGPLENAIYDLVALHHKSPYSSDFSDLCEKAMIGFRPMIDGIVHAKRNVSPKVFALELRHYYDAISLRGKKYLGPGAVEMPLFVFEHLLWSCDNTDSKYKRFKEGYIPYIFPELRKIYDNFENEKSLISKMRSEISKEQPFNESLFKSARTLLKLCSMVRSFRLPHKKLAASAYGNDLAQRDHGSGGYSMDTLEHIDQVMCQSVKEMKASFESKSACPVAH